MRRVCIVTGYRSDYTKLKSVIESIKTHPDLELQILAYGAHLLFDHGNTISNIEADGHQITLKCSTNVEGDSPLVMSKSVGLAVIELASAFESLKPDIVLVVGDRYEILAAAIAASVGNIPVAHVQGGEISGTIDETIRHAITKLSHIHFPATELSAKRLVLMGEKKEHIFNVGCPAVDYIKNIKYRSRLEIKNLKGSARLKIDLEKPYFILIQHPVTTEYGSAGLDMEITLNALQEVGIQTILIYPNPDAGSRDMIRIIRKHSRKYGKDSIVYNRYKNLPFETYLNLLKHCSCLVGNSSSGIREAHIFNVPVVNIGSRQHGRERTPNIVDVENKKEEIIKATKDFKRKLTASIENPYGTGTAGAKIAKILKNIDIDDIINKTLTLG